MTRSETEQANSLAAYLPEGRAWAAKHIAGSVTRGLLVGLSGELLRSTALVDEFREEILPDRTTLFVSEWERALAIPDGCFTGQGTLDERRNDVLAKLASFGVQTADDMRLLALKVYGIDLIIKNPTRNAENTFPYTFQPTGDPDLDGNGGVFTFGLSDREARFQIIIEYQNVPVSLTFPLTFPIPFLNREVATLECLFAKLRPANVGFTNDIIIPSSSPIPTPIPPVFPSSTVSLEFDDAAASYGLFTGVDLADATFFDFGFPNVSGAFSISAWVKPVAASTTATILQFGLESAGVQNRFRLREDTNTGVLRVDVFDDGTGNAKQYDVLHGILPSFDTWYQIVVTYDGGNDADSLQIYINGTLATPTKVTDDDISGMLPLTMIGSIGGNKGLAAEPGKHRIYSVATYDVELTSAQVLATYHKKNPSVFDLLLNTGVYDVADNLQSWWRPGSVLTAGGTTPPGLGQDFGPKAVHLVHEQVVDDDDVQNDFPVPTFQNPIRSLVTGAGGEMPETSAAALGITDTFTIAFWAKSETSSGGGVDVAWSVRHTGTRNSIELGGGFNVGADDFRYFLVNDADTTLQAGVFDDVIDGATSGAPWHHYVCTWEGSAGGWKFYVDGVDQGIADSGLIDLASTGIVDSTSRKQNIGGRVSGSGDRWEGPIYSVAIWNFEATQAQVTTLYNGGDAKGQDVDVIGLPIHYYQLGLSSVPAEFGLDRAPGGTADLGAGGLDATDLTTDIPT